MRISINLATRPFLELRPVLLRLRLAMAGLLLLAIALAIGNHILAGRASAAEAQVNQLRQETSAYQQERQADERRMQQPQNRDVLERSRFLNALFQRKGFSWTAVMMDLERVLPPGVQVTSIEPVVTPDGDVNIRLRVSGERDRAVELVRNLERSQRFLHPELANESAQTQENGRTVNVAQPAAPGGVEFDILSGYNPLPPTTAPAKKADSSAPGATASAKPHPRRPRKGGAR